MAQSPDAIAAKWAQNLGSSTQRIQDGVQAVTVAPGMAAAAQKQVYLANVQASADKWATNTAKVTKEEWQAAMIDKGLQRIASGAAAAQPKFTTFMGRLLPYQENLRRTLPARGNLEANINRMVAFTRGMSKFQNR